MYKCEICGKEWPSIAERAKCEIACAKKLQEEEKKAAEAKKQVEKDVRKNELEEAIKHAAKLLDDYMKDYGKFEYESDSKDKCTLAYFWPDNLWYYFL